MRNWLALVVGMVPALFSGPALAQYGHMANGGMWGFGWMGGYGGAWLQALFVLIVVGLVAWVVKQKDK